MHPTPVLQRGASPGPRRADPGRRRCPCPWVLLLGLVLCRPLLAQAQSAAPAAEPEAAQAPGELPAPGPAAAGEAARPGTGEPSPSAGQAPAGKCASACGELRIIGLPAGARIYLDRQLAAVDNSGAPLPLSGGQHLLWVKAAGFRTWEQGVKVRAGQTVTVTARMVPLDGGSSFWLSSTVLGLILTAGAAGVGIGFGLRANTYLEDSGKFKNNKYVSIAGYATAGAFGALTLTSFVMWSVTRKVEQPPRGAALIPLPGGALLSGSARF